MSANQIIGLIEIGVLVLWLFIIAMVLVQTSPTKSSRRMREYAWDRLLRDGLEEYRSDPITKLDPFCMDAVWWRRAKWVEYKAKAKDRADYQKMLDLLEP